MANVLHRETLEYLQSVNTPDYDPAVWLINPSLPECDRAYWKVVGDSVVEMSAEEKTVVTGAADRVTAITAVEAQYAAALAGGYDTGLGFRLAATLEDQARFSQDAILQSQRISLNLATGSVEVVFLDIAQAPHTCTLDEYLRMLCDYGQWCRDRLLERVAQLAALQ